MRISFSNPTAKQIAVDPIGNAYVVMEVYGDINCIFPPSLLKYDSDGNLLIDSSLGSIRTLTTRTGCAIDKVVVDSSENVYVCGGMLDSQWGMLEYNASLDSSLQPRLVDLSAGPTSCGGMALNPDGIPVTLFDSNGERGEGLLWEHLDLLSPQSH